MLSRGYTSSSPCRATLRPVSLHFFPRLATKSSRFKDPSYANEVLFKNAMYSLQETDSVVISVEGSDETPAATGLIAFDSKLDMLVGLNGQESLSRDRPAYSITNGLAKCRRRVGSPRCRTS